MKRIYLDYAATTPVDPAVLDAMQPYFTETFGNPGSLHSFGQAASGAVFIARQMIAKELNCHYSEVIFTGSATEANNLALRGAVKNHKPRLIISAIEHESILQTAKDLEKTGAEVVVIPVSKEGIIDLKKLKAALTRETVLVSVMFANNEIGTIQSIAEIAKVIRDFRGAAKWPLLHTDAAQALNYLSCDVEALGVDLMTLSSQKIYGPKGAGALYVRSMQRGVSRVYPISPWQTGGGQEFGLRSGTENVASIVGFSKAVGLAAMDREEESVRIGKLRNQAWEGVKKLFPKAELNGSPEVGLPNILNFYVPGVSGEQLLVTLDLHGVAVSSGSACAARSIDPSHVLLALGHDEQRAKNSVRISLGRMTTKQEIKDFLAALKKVRDSLENE